MAFGRDSVPTLKKVIDQSAAGADPAMPTMQMNVAISPILAFAAAFSNDATVTALAQSMQAANGTDKIVVVARSIPNGQTARIELQEGALQAIGTAVKAATGQ